MAKFVLEVELEVYSEDEDGLEIAPPSGREVSEALAKVIARSLNMGSFLEEGHMVENWNVDWKRVEG